MQSTIILWVELVNCLIIIETGDPLNTVLNFVALTIIAEFDNYVFESLRNERLTRLLNEDVIEHIFVI